MQKLSYHKPADEPNGKICSVGFVAIKIAILATTRNGVITKRSQALACFPEKMLIL